MEVHIPPGSIPRAYGAQVRNFLDWLGLDRKYEAYFHIRSRLRRYLSIMVKYFNLFSWEIRNSVRKLMASYVRTVGRYYRARQASRENNKFVWDPEELIRTGDRVDTPELYVSGRITHLLFVYWDTWIKSFQKFTVTRLSYVEVASCIRFSRIF